MCFSALWVRDLIVWVIVIAAVVAIIQILLPWIVGKIGGDGGVLVRVVTIILWAFVAICIVYFLFALMSCVFAGGLPLMHRY